MFYIYLVTSPSGKHYVGLTSNFERRKYEHHKPGSGCIALKNAIQEYGDQLKWEIIEECPDLETAKEKEVFYIAEYNSKHNGYNISYGGDYCTSRGKLNTEQLTNIRELLEENVLGMQEIADIYEVSISTISGIKNNKTWNFLEGAKVIKRESLCHKRTGEKNPNSRLTEEIVRNMKLEYMEDKITIRQLAKKYEMGFSLAQQILSETWWKHVVIEGYDYQSIAKKRDANKKLTEDQVRIIRKRIAVKVLRKDIAKEFNISIHTIDGIRNGKLWKNLK